MPVASVQERWRPRAATAFPIGVTVLEIDAVPNARNATAPLPDGAMDACGPFRYALVELMLTVVEAWERSTGRPRLELAESSRLWHITVDDGRLRARAMERYLSLSRLPRHPRWREVVRSAYYVLNECALEPCVRVELQSRVDAVLAHRWRQALGRS
ncbi:hypothetical protein [Luteimonas aquatica]|uniref:hypothetical protein n=1 Tax=Luteimonas aquatica TaxID=450364 RepID=UPI001F575D35|nr:hypothetical protein [Luteimonas aquatica]